jgi:hypothetical protein
MCGKGVAVVRRSPCPGPLTRSKNDNVTSSPECGVDKALEDPRQGRLGRRQGALVFEANVGNKRYILWDSNRDAPPGFGARVAGKKIDTIRRKVAVFRSCRSSAKKKKRNDADSGPMGLSGGCITVVSGGQLNRLAE